MNSLKSLLITMVLGIFSLSAFSQTEKPNLYDPMADARKEISEAVAKAQLENKHVFIQVGGNW